MAEFPPQQAIQLCLVTSHSFDLGVLEKKE